MAEGRRRLLGAYCRAAAIDPDVLTRPGITIVGESDRSGTGVASAYQLDRHLVVRCDPAVVDRCRALVPEGLRPTLAGFESVMPDGAERLGRGFVHVWTGPDPSFSPQGRVLDPTRPGDLALIESLVASDPAGADDAEIELDGLDGHIVGIEVDGVLAAYVSERPWWTDPAFADIGVLTHPDHRRQGLADAALRELCRRVWEAGRLPLYRCDATNVASRALAARAGFVEVVRLTAAIL